MNFVKLQVTNHAQLENWAFHPQPTKDKVMAKQEFVVVGLNGTGRTLASLLGAYHQGTVTLMDEDLVTKESFNQGYSNVDLGLSKVQAVEEAVTEFSKSSTFRQFTNLDCLLDDLTSQLGNTVVFCCKPMTAKTRAYVAKTLASSCPYLYFCGYDATGSYTIQDSRDPDYANNLVELQSCKENVAKCGLAAVDMFVRHANNSSEFTGK